MTLGSDWLAIGMWDLNALTARGGYHTDGVRSSDDVPPTSVHHSRRQSHGLEFTIDVDRVLLSYGCWSVLFPR
jgi:hypothetical protein